MNSKTTKAVLCGALGNIIWGFSFLFTRMGLDVAPDPKVMLSHRFALSALFMAFAILMRNTKFATNHKLFVNAKVTLKGKNRKPLAILLATQIGYYVFETYGLIHTNATIAGMVLAVVPVATIGTGALFLKEYPTRRQALFCIMPVAGVIIMTISGKELGVVTTIGILLLLLTVVDSAIFKTANRQAAEEFSAFERTFLVLAMSSVFFTVMALNAVGWDIKAYLAPLAQFKYLFAVMSLSLLCSIVANLLVNYAAGILSVFQLSAFGALSTLCSVFAGVVFLTEPMDELLFLGAVLILVGIHEVTKPK